MCEACANKLLELAEEARPLPDQMGDGRVANALKLAADMVRPVDDHVMGTMLRYESRCLKLAGTLQTLLNTLQEKVEQARQTLR